jgi:hypothetical protein
VIQSRKVGPIGQLFRLDRRPESSLAESELQTLADGIETKMAGERRSLQGGRLFPFGVLPGRRTVLAYNPPVDGTGHSVNPAKRSDRVTATGIARTSIVCWALFGSTMN